MKKVDVFQTFEDTNMKRLQTVYLNFHGFTAKEITKWTGYAISTIKTYVKKFEELVEEAKKSFLSHYFKSKKGFKGWQAAGLSLQIL